MGREENVKQDGTGSGWETTQTHLEQMLQLFAVTCLNAHRMVEGWRIMKVRGRHYNNLSQLMRIRQSAQTPDARLRELSYKTRIKQVDELKVPVGQRINQSDCVCQC